MRYYIIVGEASGDLHASNLMKELKVGDPQAEFRAWGGDLMEEEGATIVRHYRDLAFMGFLEVLLNIRTIFRNISFCKKDILSFQPDVVILVDYPGFNLRIASFAHENGFKVFYYISPQIWAWKENRVKQIKAYVDEMYVILPFEKDFYSKLGLDVNFVGHPLIDAVSNYSFASDIPSNQSQLNAGKSIIALLPGSRKQEISKVLPIMLKTIEALPEYRYVVAGAPSQTADFYLRYLKNFPQVELVFGQTYELLKQSRAAMVTSGTATLETAIFKVPQVVCYKGSWLSYFLARQLIKVKFISLVNLIMDRQVVLELIQAEMNEQAILAEIKRLIQDGEYRQKLLVEYEELFQRLGGGGASKLTAQLMLKSMGVKAEEF